MSAYIFIDAENVKPEIGFTAVEKFSCEYFVEQVEIIGNESNISSKYLEAGNQYQIKNCFFGKNSADTWLCTEIAKTIFEKPDVDVIIIISSDRDFLAAVKLVTDKKKKIIFVSDGNGHKNLKSLLYDLRINPDLIELVDFKNISLPEKKKGTNNSMEIFSPNPAINKIRELCKKPLPSHSKNFFTKNEANIQFIPVTHAGKEIAIPFMEGINLSTFTNILIALKIIPNGRTLLKIIDENAFKIENNCVYRVETIEPAEKDENAFNAVIDYFTAHAAESKNIFIKCKGNLQEIPFVDGISLEIFSELLKGYEISNDAEEIKKIIADSFLDLRDDKIYFKSEETFSEELNAVLKKIPIQALEFIRKHQDKLQLVSITHNDTVAKVPFADGMHLGIFVNMLRTLQIIGKKANSSNVLENNGFTVINNFVYKK